MKFTGRFQNLSACTLIAALAVSCFSGLAFPRFEVQAADKTTEKDHSPLVSIISFSVAKEPLRTRRLDVGQ